MIHRRPYAMLAAGLASLVLCASAAIATESEAVAPAPEKKDAQSSSVDEKPQATAAVCPPGTTARKKFNTLEEMLAGDARGLQAAIATEPAAPPAKKTGPEVKDGKDGGADRGK